MSAFIRKKTNKTRNKNRHVLRPLIFLLDFMSRNSDSIFSDMHLTSVEDLMQVMMDPYWMNRIDLPVSGVL